MFGGVGIYGFSGGCESTGDVDQKGYRRGRSSEEQQEQAAKR